MLICQSWSGDCQKVGLPPAGASETPAPKMPQHHNVAFAREPDFDPNTRSAMAPNLALS